MFIIRYQFIFYILSLLFHTFVVVFFGFGLRIFHHPTKPRNAGTGLLAFLAEPRRSSTPPESVLERNGIQLEMAQMCYNKYYVILVQDGTNQMSKYHLYR